MLVTQFYGANASGFYGAGLAGTDPAAIKLLQQTLKNAGKSGGNVSNPNGVMDGYTLAAAYEILRDKGGPMAQVLATMANQGAGDAVGKAFQTLRDLDAKLSQVPGISLSIPSLLKDATKVSQVISVAQAALAFKCNGLGGFGDFCSTATDIVTKLQNGLNTFFSTMSGAAPALLKVMKALGLQVPATTTTTTTTPRLPIKTSILTTLAPKVTATTATRTTAPTPTAPTLPAGAIYAFSKKLGKYRIAVPKAAGFAGFGIADSSGDCMFGDCGLGADATFTEIAPSDTKPTSGTATTETDLEKKTGTLPFYKKPLFWAAVGGGVVVVGGGSYWLIRRRKRSV